MIFLHELYTLIPNLMFITALIDKVVKSIRGLLYK